MPNPYEDIFNSEGNEKKNEQDTSSEETPSFGFSAFEDDGFEVNTEESLDEILSNITLFNQKADAFSKLLSQTRAVDHKVNSGFASLFFEVQDPHDKRYLGGERKYHESLTKKFEAIIVPMRELAELHLKTVKRFNDDIDDNYFSVEKSDFMVKKEKELAVDGIQLQRTVLADAASSLNILKDSLAKTESRLKKYINAGGRNNISVAEYQMITQKREALTNGRQHHFDYTFFNMNMLDKAAISFGYYMKQTSNQYVNQLKMIFEIA